MEDSINTNVDAEKIQKDKLKEITDKLETGIKELYDSEKYVTWLNTMSKFHQYSLNNTILIAMQHPGATMVAGFTQWQKDFERHVKKGSKAIRILAWNPYKEKIEKDKIDPDTKEPIKDENGNTVKIVKEVQRPSYKVVNVFDISQTEGKTLSTLGVNELEGSVNNFEVFFEALKRACPVRMSFEDIQGSAKGYFHQKEQRIAIKEGMSEIQTIKTAIHEMAHQKLHSEEIEKIKGEKRAVTRNEKEIEAESVAYTVCQHFGIDTSDYSFGYVAGWSEGKELAELKASLLTIRRAAASMINDIEGHIKEINLERDAVKEPEISENATISFYVAECMEFPTYGEYHEVDTLKEAFDKLDLIPPLRLNGNPGIGFIVHDEGSDISEAMYPLVQAGQIQYGALNLVDYYKRSPLVNGVVAECEQILKDRKEGRSGIVSPKTENQSKKKKSVFADLRQKKAMIANKASVAAKAQEAQL